MAAAAWRRVPFRLTWEGRDRHRWITPLVAAGGTAGLVLAVFGLPPVDLHGPLHYLGVMGPSCGGTRAMYATLTGDLGNAFRYNPLSPLLVLFGVAAMLREVTGRLTGRWLNVRLTCLRVAVAWMSVLLIALSVNQQAHADLLRTGPQSGVPAGLMLFAVVAAPICLSVVALVVRRSLRVRREPGADTR